jgi:hypothetical protein
MCKHVLYFYNIQVDNVYFHKNIIELIDGDSTPSSEQIKRIETAIEKRIKPILEDIKPYVVSGSCALCTVEIIPNEKPVVKQNSQIDYKMVIRTNYFMESKPTAYKIRFITPNGVEVLSPSNVMMVPATDDFVNKVNFTVKLGEVSTDVKIIAEFTVPGRSTALYVPFTIFA